MVFSHFILKSPKFQKRVTTRVTTFSPFHGMTERQILNAHKVGCRSLGAFVRHALDKSGSISTALPEVPAWYKVCFESYWAAAWKAFPSEFSEETMTANKAGYALGYLRWMLHFIEEMDTKMAQLNWPMPMFSPAIEKQMDAVFEKTVFPREICETIELIETGKADEDMQAVSVKLNELPYSQAVQFADGQSKGMLGPSGRADGELAETDATKIYLLLMIFWETIITFQSVAVLHRFLVLLLGRNRVGEKERIGKICERIGLKLRGRGRPKNEWPPTFRKKHGRK